MFKNVIINIFKNVPINNKLSLNIDINIFYIVL